MPVPLSVSTGRTEILLLSTAMVWYIIVHEWYTLRLFTTLLISNRMCREGCEGKRKCFIEGTRTTSGVKNCSGSPSLLLHGYWRDVSQATGWPECKSDHSHTSSVVIEVFGNLTPSYTKLRHQSDFIQSISERTLRNYAKHTISTRREMKQSTLNIRERILMKIIRVDCLLWALND
jgi:hypothetical protein